MFGSLGPTELIYVLISLLLIFLFWRIFKKAGFPGWPSVFAIIPGVAIIVLIFLAFSKWPNQKQ